MKHVFEPDGFVREIHVRNAGIEGWQRFIDALRQSDYNYTYSLDNKEPALLQRAQQAFDEYRDIGSSLSVTVDSVLILVHFFDPQHIETSIDPREITGPDRLGIIFDWMKFLAGSTGQHAILAPEGSPHDVLIEVSAAGEVIHVSPRHVFRRRWYWPFVSR